MKAVVLSGVTPAGEIRLSEVKTPEAVPGWVVVKIKAFGLNHSEKILRLDEIRAEYIRKPVIPGIECAEEIADGSDTPLRPGRKVIAMMGGMGRSFDGSYAEYALLPAHHVFAVQTDMPWEELGALPETFFTAWGSLFEGLRLEAGDTLARARRDLRARICGDTACEGARLPRGRHGAPGGKVCLPACRRGRTNVSATAAKLPDRCGRPRLWNSSALRLYATRCGAWRGGGNRLRYGHSRRRLSPRRL